MVVGPGKNMYQMTIVRVFHLKGFLRTIKDMAVALPSLLMYTILELVDKTQVYERSAFSRRQRTHFKFYGY